MSLHSFRNHLSTDLTPRIRLSNKIGDGTKTMLKDHLSTTISATLLQTTAGTTRLRATTTATSTKMLPFPTKATERLNPVPQDHMCLHMRTTSRMSKAK